MKAIVYEKYGSPDVLELQEIDVPVLEDDQVLVKAQRSVRQSTRLAPHDEASRSSSA